MQPGGRIVALRGDKCISEHDGLVSLGNCETSGAWEMQADNQLKSGSGGGMCLSGSGASSGLNVALRAAVHASSAIDAAHGARCFLSFSRFSVCGCAAMVTRASHCRSGHGRRRNRCHLLCNLVARQPRQSASAFRQRELGAAALAGASGVLGSGEPVVMTLDIGETQPLQRVEILWEFPAKSFSLSVSSDGLSWSEVYATDVNGLQKTSVNLGHQSARKLRLVMREVHARCAAPVVRALARQCVGFSGSPITRHVPRACCIWSEVFECVFRCVGRYSGGLWVQRVEQRCRQQMVLCKRGRTRRLRFAFLEGGTPFT